MSQTIMHQPNHPTLCTKFLSGLRIREEETFFAFARCGSGGEESEGFFDDAERVFEFMENFGILFDALGGLRDGTENCFVFFADALQALGVFLEEVVRVADGG